MTPIDQQMGFCRNDQLFGHAWVTPLLNFHGRIASTFDTLSEELPVCEIACRICTVIVAPLAYLALGLLALVGTLYKFTAFYCQSRDLSDREPRTGNLMNVQLSSDEIARQSNLVQGNLQSADEEREDQPNTGIRSESSVIPVTRKTIELQGITRYTYPVSINAYEAKPVFNSFQVCEGLLWLSRHINEVQIKFVEDDVDYFKNMQRVVIDNGSRAYAEDMAASFGQIDDDANPCNLHRFTQRYSYLLNPFQNYSSVALSHIHLELDRLFGTSEVSKQRFAIVQMKKMSFVFLALGQDLAFLLDPNGSAFSLGSKDWAQFYIQSVYNRFGGSGNIDFNYGEI